ncbi:MAG: ATP-binding cassette domain-containing protein [Rhodospirillaceae bacterium]
MARQIPRFEADTRLFDKANIAAKVLSDGFSAGFPAPDHAAIGGALRLPRLEGIDADAPGMAHGSQIQAPDPETDTGLTDDSAEVEAEDFRAELSDATEIRSDWTSLALMAGGDSVAYCLYEMLTALNWVGDPRQVAEVLPTHQRGLNQADLRRVFHELGYSSKVSQAVVHDVGADDLPAMFIDREGRAFVLLEASAGTVSGFDGARRIFAPVPITRSQGTIIQFYRAETATPTPSLPCAGTRAARDFVLSAIARMWPFYAGGAALSGMFGLAAAIMLLVALDHAVPSGSIPQILFYSGLAVIALFLEGVALRTLRRAACRRVASARDHGRLRVLLHTLMLPVDAIRNTTANARLARHENLTSNNLDALARGSWGLAYVVIAGVFIAFIAVVGRWFVLGPVLILAMMIAAGELAVQGFSPRWAALLRARFRARNAVASFRDRAKAALQAGCADALEDRVVQSISSAVDAETAAQSANARIRLMLAVLSAAGLAGGVIQGLNLHEAGMISAGQLAACLFLSWCLYRAAEDFYGDGASFGQLQAMLMEQHLLAAAPKDRRVSTPSAPPKVFSGHIDVRGIYCHAENAIEAPLEDVGFHAQPGDVVVIAGGYRSGKSLMLRAIAGLATPSSGQIRLDGADIAAFDPIQLRQSVAYVPETPEFLDLTLAENLRLSNPLAKDADLHNACALAGVLEEIQSLETGSGRDRRSGFELEMNRLTTEPFVGLFKKLALARGYLALSNILLFDNPDRYLDPNGLQEFMGSVEQLREGKTLIIASDKPSVIRLADKVVWIDEGRVRALGPSDEVLENLYASGQIGQTMEAE